MSCSAKRKSCHDKSCARYYNNTPQAFAAGVPLQLAIGNRVVDSGIAIEPVALGYNTVKAGLYHLAADVVATATTPGTGTFAIYMDGVILPCTVRNISLYAGVNEIHSETDLSLRGCCCDVEHSFTYVLTTAAAVGTVDMFCTGVLKLA